MGPHTESRRPHILARSTGPGSEQAGPDGAFGLHTHTCHPPHTRAAAPVAALPTSQHQAPAAPGAVLTDSTVALLSALTVCPAPRRALPMGHLIQSPPRPLRQEGSAAFPKGKLRLREDQRLAWGQSRARVGPHGLAWPLWADSSASPGSPREHQVPPCPGWASIPEKQRGHNLPGIPPLSGSPVFWP